MYCSNCGKQLAEQSKFCNECGSSTNAAQYLDPNADGSGGSTTSTLAIIGRIVGVVLIVSGTVSILRSCGLSAF